MVTMVGGHTLRTASSTQSVIAMSSGESEFYGLVKAASALIGFGSLARDWGLDVKLRLWADSSSAIGTASRRGAGKIKHIHTQTLWIQRAVADQVLVLRKVKGTQNVADAGTKYLSGPVLAGLLARMNVKTCNESDSFQLDAAQA